VFTAVNSWYIDIHNFTDSVSLGRAKVTLDGGRLAGEIVANGNFTMCVEMAFYIRDADSTLIPDVLNSPDVPTGPHLLSVISHDYSFDSVCNVSVL